MVLAVIATVKPFFLGDRHGQTVGGLMVLVHAAVNELNSFYVVIHILLLLTKQLKVAAMCEGGTTNVVDH